MGAGKGCITFWVKMKKKQAEISTYFCLKEVRHLTVQCIPKETTRLPTLKLQKFLFLFIQTLPYDCSHIEDVHLLYCALFIFFSFLTCVERRHFFI